MSKQVPVRKPFDLELFKQNDQKARLVITKYLQALGYVVSPNPNTYGVDLIAERGNNRYGIEVEIKRVWKGPKLPWDTVQLPERKAKYRLEGLPVTYCILNNELTHALTFTGSMLDTLTPIVVPNKYVSKGEKFYQVPVSICDYIELELDGEEK